MKPSREDAAIAQELTRRLVAEFAPRRVVWFGSRSRGQGDAASDWDLLVVVDSTEPLSERLYRAQRATAEIAVAKDIIVCNQAEHARLSGWKSSVVAAAETSGTVVYQATR